jgi:hypothetical protein
MVAARSDAQDPGCRLLCPASCVPRLHHAACIIPTASLQGRVDAVAQCRGVERLSKKADSTGCHGPLTHLGGRKCRHENDWKKVTLRGQSALQLEAVHLRHLHIAYDAEGPCQLWRSQKLLGGGEAARRPTERSDQSVSRDPGRGVIIDDRNNLLVKQLVTYDECLACSYRSRTPGVSRNMATMTASAIIPRFASADL